MEKRLKVHEKGQEALKTLYGIGGYLRKSRIEVGLRELVYFKVSQMNNCPFCIDMHYKDARAQGESEQRLYGVSAWRDTPYYNDRERAALAWAEAVTKCKVPDEVYQIAKSQFTDEELIDLTLVITSINTWNRINLAFPNTPGEYKVGQFR